MLKLTPRKIQNKLNIRDYKNLDRSVYGSILKLKKTLYKKTIIHINATAQGGGVAELLVSQVALERSLGMNSLWFCLKADLDFFRVTKKIHNLLQGMPGRLSLSEQKIYLKNNQQFAQAFNKISKQLKPDVVIIHDAQPLPMIANLTHKSNLILRLHIDLSEPNPWLIDFLNPFMAQYQQVIVSGNNYVKILPPRVQKNTTSILPAIDPLSEKNLDTKLSRAIQILKKVGLDTSRPIITQVSRFDPWKDPKGVIQSYRIAKKRIPNLQLVLAGIITAKDDPQAWAIFDEVKKYSQNDPDIFLFSDLSQLQGYTNDTFINALLTASSIIIQKSIKEGFGLTVTEAMWKGKPVVGGMAYGTRQQILNRKNGIIIQTTQQAANAIVELLQNPRLANRLGKAARQSVKRKFLLTRFLIDNLKTYIKLIKTA